MSKLLNKKSVSIVLWPSWVKGKEWHLDDYESLLDTAIDELPEGASERSGERFQVPEVQSVIQGTKTIWQNLHTISRVLDRPEKEVVKFFVSRLGTTGKILDTRAIFKGRFVLQQLSDILVLYIKTYVTCPNCGRPDTVIKKDKNGYSLSCSACGEWPKQNLQ